LPEHTNYRIHNERVIHETVDGEVLVIDSVNGHYHSIAGTGSFVWAMLEQPQDCESIASSLAAAHGSDATPIRTDVEQFLNQLEGIDLIIATNESILDIPMATEAIGAYAPPKLSSHTDLEDLLVFDPIHEVGEGGWPERKAET